MKSLIFSCLFWSGFAQAILEANLSGDPNAQTVKIKIPAPRGVITDRNGTIFVGNRIRQIASIDFRYYDPETHGDVSVWVQKIVSSTSEVIGKPLVLKEGDIAKHFRSRRWMLMPFGTYLTNEEFDKLKQKEGSGLSFLQVYSRDYKHAEAFAHVAGYVGAEARFQRGPILRAENLWPQEIGRAGLEKIYDDLLTGEPGEKHLVYNGRGELVVNRILERPKAGGAIVTTLDAAWQQKGYDLLQKYTKKGAFSVVDVDTGEVLVLASNPSYDTNLFVPRISTENYSTLRDDPNKPLYPRAFSAAYPPASTFKPFVALAAMQGGIVDETTMIDCGVDFKVGSLTFKNWSKVPEGEINVTRAIARSCNTWFYPVGIDLGAENFLKVAREMGFGQSVDHLPLLNASSGYVPSEREHVKRYGWGFADGDAANLSIGQGSLLASPLQVAHAMAGLASGQKSPKLSLLKQKINAEGKVIYASEPQAQQVLTTDINSLITVHEGMMQVVHASYGTGKAAKLSYATLCGKTGTAEWGPESENKRLAWFAGFFPLEKPKYAFAALYEGDKNESVSGGRKAAPIVSEFFEFFKDEISPQIDNKASRSTLASYSSSDGVYLMRPLVDGIHVNDEFDVFEQPSQSFNPYIDESEVQVLTPEIVEIEE